MSRRAWLTPEDAPGADVCVQVFIPGGRDYLAAFRGAFLLLCEAFNWETHGAQSPQTVADAFMSAFFHIQDEGGQCVVAHHVGEVFLFGSYTGPDGALPCNGAFYSPGAYPALFAVIGTLFGGDGVNDFAVPDLRGRVPVGVGEDPVYFNQYDMGSAGGDNKHILTGGELPAHHHTVARQSTGGGTNATLAWSTTANALAVLNTSDVGSGQPHNNMQAYLPLGFYIQAE